MCCKILCARSLQTTIQSQTNSERETEREKETGHRRINCNLYNICPVASIRFIWGDNLWISCKAQKEITREFVSKSRQLWRNYKTRWLSKVSSRSLNVKACMQFLTFIIVLQQFSSMHERKYYLTYLVYVDSLYLKRRTWIKYMNEELMRLKNALSMHLL